MAEPISVQQLKDASLDVKSLEEVVNGDENVVVTTRLGETYPSIKSLLENTISKFGFIVVDSFEVGATLTQRNQALRHAEDGNLYRWAGELPKTVAANSTPESSGGFGDNAWLEVSDTALRQEILIGGLLTDTLVTSTANGVGTVARTQRDKNSDLVSVKDFGAKGDASFDDAPAIQAAFDYAAQNKVTIYVPNGTYRVDDMVKIDGGGAVEFAQNATLIRLSEYSDKTTPVFCVRGNLTYSVGGRFVSQNASPNGVITLGHMSQEDRQIACWWRCIRPYVGGVKAAGNIGIYVPSGQATQGSVTANYFGHIDNPIIRYCDDGIVFTEVSNAHTVIAPQFYQCMTSAITMYGAYANNIVGGFLHKSDNGIIGVRLKDSRVEGMSHNSWWNSVTGFGVEPGGTSSKPFEIDAKSTRNILKLIGNVAGSAIVHGNWWDNDFDTGYTKSSPKQSFTSVDVTGADGSPSEFLFDKYYTASIPTSVEGATHIVAESAVSAATGGMYEVVVHGHAPSLGRHTPSRYIIAFNRYGSNPVVVEIVESNVSSKSAATLQVEPNSGGTGLIWTVKFVNNGTGTNINQGGLQIRHMRHTGGKSDTKTYGDIKILPEYKYGSVT